MEKILTISVAAYNVESYIRQTLDSLLATEVLDKLEVFVVDDGGRDGTLEIAKEYEAKYPATFYAMHKENGGYGSTINYSVARATGKYFKQLDGDDWFQTDNMAALIKLLETVNTDCIYTQTIELYEQTGKQRCVDHFEYLREGKYRFDEVDFENMVSMHETIIKTSILQQMNLHITEHCFYTDVEYVNLPVPYLTDFYVLHSPIYVYRLGREGQSVSVEGIKKHYKEHEDVFWRVLNIYKSLDASETNKKKLIMCRLRREAARQLSYYCCLPVSIKYFCEILDFQKKLRAEAPEVIRESKKHSKMAWLLFNTKCIAYPLAALIEHVKR
jgi:glycosyltransferase involved in cell wall biosynthesis